MEGKTDSKTTGETLLQESETNIDPADRVSAPRLIVIDEHCSVIYDERVKGKIFSNW